jgi:hypothetical protein
MAVSKVSTIISETISIVNTIVVISIRSKKQAFDWKASGRQRFEAAYAPEDSVYEYLIDETPTG